MLGCLMVQRKTCEVLSALLSLYEYFEHVEGASFYYV